MNIQLCVLFHFQFFLRLILHIKIQLENLSEIARTILLAIAI